jgi:peptidyl-dipeptidase A
LTPGYLADVGLVPSAEQSEEAAINTLMREALDRVAFLPFGKLIDEWRWDVFSGRITPENYNESWWELRTRYQGIAPPVERSEADFDPGAKYHVPANVSYTRYFLAHILMFQFHRALCDAAGFEGPLHECSVYGSEAAGEKLWAMLEAGASQPWPDTLEKLTGTREMDATAIIDYFEPLMAWLREQNEGRSCGW